MKAKREHRCQICLALGGNGRAFTKLTGGDYAEAHHVISVAKLVAASLAAENVMALCPNHHRQAHYGHFDIVTDTPTAWTLQIDKQTVHIEKSRL